MVDPVASPRPDATERYFLLPSDRVLPAICPWCGAPGTQAIHLDGISGIDAGATPSVYGCDLCASADARRSTVSFAWTLTGALVGVTVATALSFFFGEREQLAQAVAVLLISGFLPLARRQRHPPLGTLVRLHRDTNADSASRSHGLRLCCGSPAFSQALTEAGFPLLDDVAAPRPRVIPWSSIGAHLVPPTVALLWWIALHFFGQAQLRVVNMGPGQVMVVVDGIRLDTVPPMRFERPAMGSEHQLLAGPREISLMTSDGRIVSSETVHVLPGQVALLVRLDPGYCIYMEKRDYALNGPPTFAVIGQGTESIQIKTRIDSWFVPLSGKSASDEMPLREDRWLQPQGHRTAVRLLACP